jgi:hypothetical protein
VTPPPAAVPPAEHAVFVVENEMGDTGQARARHRASRRAKNARSAPETSLADRGGIDRNGTRAICSACSLGQVADIVGVHGIWCDQATGPKTLDLWTRRIRVGLAESHHPDPESVSVRVAYYGHLYTDGKGTTEEFTAENADLDEFELELLTAMATAADVVTPSTDTKFGLPSSVQALLLGLVKTPYFGARATDAAVWLIRQVRRYFGDAELRANIHKEIETAMADDTKVLVGHSLGSIAAYEALRAHPEWPVRTLITLGSPLGLPGIMRRLSPPLTPVNRWPGSVTTWVNVAAKEDPVALVKHLGPLYDDRVQDRSARNTTIRGHDATQYLRTVHTARALRNALS